MSSGFGGSTTRSFDGLEREVESRMAAYSDEKHTSTIAVMHSGRLLMGKRRDNGLWTMPGGGVNPGEDPHAGAVRELFEEAGIRVKALKHLGSDAVTGRSGRAVNVHSYKIDMPQPPHTNSHNDPDNEVSGWQWIDVSDGLPKEVEKNLHSPKNILLKRLGLLGSCLQSNQFHDDFEPGSDAFIESDEDIVKKSGPYDKPHDDFDPSVRQPFSRMAESGDPKDQEPMDALDREVQRYESQIKDPADQFPMSKVMVRLSEGIDEALWKKAKDASQEAFGKIKWAFVMWWYEDHGGK